MSGQANIVVVGGALSGTWSLDGDQASLSLFQEAGSVPMNALEEETARLAKILDRPLQLSLG